MWPVGAKLYRVNLKLCRIKLDGSQVIVDWGEGVGSHAPEALALHIQDQLQLDVLDVADPVPGPSGFIAG